MRSGSAAMAIVSIGLLAGCGTTQQEARRLQLNAARIRATEQPVRVTRADPAVKVEDVQLVRGRSGAALVVRLRSVARHTLTDLPISVGLRPPHGRREYLNSTTGGDYFDAHVASIGAGASLTWVFATHRRLPPRARAFATVGHPSPGFSTASTLPRIAVSALPRSASADSLELSVHNATSVPQYQLQVYAAVRGAHGYLSAGKGEIAHLGSGASTDLHVKLLGRPTAEAPAVQATPTIFG